MATILIVDDDADLRDLLHEVFVRAGYRVLTASDGWQGLHLARQYLPDVILTDLDMPRLDGTQLCQAVREDPQLCEVPVAVLSGTVHTHDHDHDTRTLGSCAVMLELMSNKHLTAVISHLIDAGRYEHIPGGCCDPAGTG